MTQAQDAVARAKRIQDLLTEAMSEIEYASAVDGVSLPIAGALVEQIARVRGGAEMIAFRQAVGALVREENAK